MGASGLRWMVLVVVLPLLVGVPPGASSGEERPGPPHGAEPPDAKEPWRNLRTLQGDDYTLRVPESWRQFNYRQYNLLAYFDASGRWLPAVYNKAPVIIRIFLHPVRNEGGLEGVKTRLLHGYRQNRERRFPPGHTPGAEAIRLTSGEPAWLLNTRFYRPAKGLHQSRFDLVIYSPHSRKAYLYGVSIQYRDPTYGFEKRFRLRQRVKRLFSLFSLKPFGRRQLT